MAARAEVVERQVDRVRLTMSQLEGLSSVSATLNALTSTTMRSPGASRAQQPVSSPCRSASSEYVCSAEPWCTMHDLRVDGFVGSDLGWYAPSAALLPRHTAHHRQAWRRKQREQALNAPPKRATREGASADTDGLLPSR